MTKRSLGRLAHEQVILPRFEPKERKKRKVRVSTAPTQNAPHTAHSHAPLAVILFRSDFFRGHIDETLACLLSRVASSIPAHMATRQFLRARARARTHTKYARSGIVSYSAWKNSVVRRPIALCSWGGTPHR